MNKLEFSDYSSAFASLTGRLLQLHRVKSVPLYFLFGKDYQPDSPGDYMNHYPASPTEIYGHSDGVMDASDVRHYNIQDNTDITIVQACSNNCTSIENAMKRRLHIESWLLNGESQKKYNRIAELAITEFEGDTYASSNQEEVYDADIFWLESDGSAWHRHYFDSDRRQLCEAEIEELASFIARCLVRSRDEDTTN